MDKTNNIKIREKCIFWALRIIAYSIVLVTGYVLFDIIFHGIGSLNWQFLTEFPRRSGAEGGIYPAIIGTLCLVITTIVIALPLGIASAVYITEYAKQGPFVRAVHLAITTLAGVPSVVFGLFGLGLFVLFLGMGTSIIAGSLTLACLILPTIIVSSIESLRSVPHSFRQGSLALGATKWTTIRTNVLPYATPGILTGAILGISRAAGETAPILLTVAAFFLPRLPRSIFDQVMALPYHLYILATQHPEAAKVRPKQYGTALVLLIIVLGINLIAILLRSRYRKKYKW